MSILGHKETFEVLFSVFTWKLRAEMGQKERKNQFHFLKIKTQHRKVPLKIFIQLFYGD